MNNMLELIILVITFCGGYFLGKVTDKSTHREIERYKGLVHALNKQGFIVNEKYYETRIVKRKK